MAVQAQIRISSAPYTAAVQSFLLVTSMLLIDRVLGCEAISGELYAQGEVTNMEKRVIELTKVCCCRFMGVEVWNV